MIKIRDLGFGLVLAGGLAGTAAYADQARSAGALASTRATLQRAIKPGTSFVDFRRVVLARGWVPITHVPPCLGQVEPALCTRLPEVFNTSSGPVEYNEMSYRYPGSGDRLHVVVEGDIAKWATADAAAELRVDSWDFGGKDGQP